MKLDCSWYNPTRLDLEVTRKCKFKCGVCSVNAGNVNYEEVSLTELKKAVEEFYKFGGTEVSITGGEPVERGLDFLIELISYCRSFDLNVRMYSVGYGFQRFRDVSKLVEAGLHTVIISLEGNREVDEEFKGVRGSYEIAINAIRLLKRAGAEVIIHFTPIKINYRYLPHVVDVAEKYNVNKVRIMSFVAQGRGWDNRVEYSLDEIELMKFNKLLLKLRHLKKKILFQFSGAFDRKMDALVEDQECALRKSRIVVTSDGIMIPSFSLRMRTNSEVPDPLFNLGNIEEETLEEAWNSPIMLSARSSGCGHCITCTGKI